MSSISTALAGIQSATNQFENAAQKIADSGNPDNTTDLAAQIVALTAAQNSIKLNVKVLRTQDEISRTLLDIRA